MRLLFSRSQATKPSPSETSRKRDTLASTRRRPPPLPPLALRCPSVPLFARRMLINFWFGRGHGLNYGLGVVYLILLLWCFMGVAIIADVFMGAIEAGQNHSTRQRPAV